MYNDNTNIKNAGRIIEQEVSTPKNTNPISLLECIKQELLDEGFEEIYENTFKKPSKRIDIDFRVNLIILGGNIYFRLVESGKEYDPIVVRGYAILYPGEIKPLLYRLISYKSCLFQFPFDSGGK